MINWKLFSLLSSAFVVVLLSIILPTNIQLPQPYTVLTPYEYPIVPETPEWLALDNNLDKINACRVPDGLAKQMSTDALLETFLTHPLVTNIFVFNTYHGGFNVIKDYYFTGLDELMGREDLDEAVLKKYIEIPICTVPPPKDMPPDLLFSTYQKEYDDSTRLDLLEVIAAEIDDSRRSISLMNAILDSYKDRAKNPKIYQKYTQDLEYYRVFVRTWAEKRYRLDFSTARPLYSR